MHYHSEEDGCVMEDIFIKNRGGDVRLSQRKCTTHNKVCWTNGWEVGWVYGTKSREVYDNPEDYVSRCDQYQVENSYPFVAGLIKSLVQQPIIGYCENRETREREVRDIRQDFVAKGKTGDLFDILEDVYCDGIVIDGKCRGFSDIRRYFFNVNQ